MTYVLVFLAGAACVVVVSGLITLCAAGPWYTLTMARHLPAPRTLTVAHMLLAGASLREATARSGVARATVTRIRRQLDDEDPALLAALRSDRRIQVSNGSTITHAALILALVKRAAITMALSNVAVCNSDGCER